MIFLAAGTQDGRQIAELLLEKGYKTAASVVSDYGKILLEKNKNLVIIEQMLDEKFMKEKLAALHVKIFLDASHPYAVNISKTAMKVCREMNIHYIRYERPIVNLPDYPQLYKAVSFDDAAEKAFQVGKRIFLTTGSRHLTEFTTRATDISQIVIARVLPVAESLAACKTAGIMPKHIIAMQGPFSKELNKAMYEQTDADVVVMKNSGKLGGADTKLMAAIETGLFVIVIDRPRIKYKNLVTDKKKLMTEIERLAKNQ
ncbi:precorrin-6A reductase [Pectinatus sottacetonis]|uniref:precorrin-6A reductase n=1 Tax=Pectinatus sottacetonis TaxID=1002795 RepID=UPI0018C63DE4|nr:precorrin-6A reductase [Pectinatus sottacetonis]